MNARFGQITALRPVLHGASWKVALALGLMALLADDANGIGFYLPNQDAEAVARGNAFVATADNPSAIFYNPAGITQIQGQDVQLGAINYLGVDVSYESPSGTHTENDFEVLPSPQLFYVFSPTDLPLSFGLGLYTPFGLGIEWPEDSGFRSIAIESRMQYLTLNPVVAWKVRPGLSLAIGPTLNYSRVKFTRGLFSPTDGFKFKGKDFAVGLSAGLLWQPCEKWSLGASYRSASTMNYRGTTFHDPGSGSLSTTTVARVRFPHIVSGGISYRPTPDWNVEFDLDWIDWRLGTVTLSGTRKLFGADLPIQLNWHDSWQTKLGATRYFQNGWSVHAGYFYSSDTTSSANFLPSIPDTELHVASLGFGHRGERWHWTLSGQILTGPERKIARDAGNTSPTGESAAGTYQVFIPTLVLSIGYRF